MAEWGYDEHNGPDTWPLKYPAAGGSKQSPIDIIKSSVQQSEFPPLKWHYGSGICKSIFNTGCGWRVDVAPGSESELNGGPLSYSYELAQFHCHWGNSNCCGSEHTIDGKPFVAELHFVHWNKEQFPSCPEAIPSPTGLTVIGVFLEEGEENSEIEKICQELEKIPNKDERVDISSDICVPLMFPSNHSYWTYYGSLTTPPCYESVTWIIFQEPISISQEQLNCFRHMKKYTEDPEAEAYVEKNFRPPQALNDRQISEYSC